MTERVKDDQIVYEFLSPHRKINKSSHSYYTPVLTRHWILKSFGHILCNLETVTFWMFRDGYVWVVGDGLVNVLSETQSYGVVSPGISLCE